MVTIHETHLHDWVAAIFQQSGASEDAAQIVAKHLVDANLAGHDSHGVMRVSQYCEAIREGILQPGQKPLVEHEGNSAVVLDGRMGFGQVAGYEAMRMAIRKARQNGVAAVTVCNCYHSGRLAAYSEQAAQNGVIGIVMVNAGGGGQSVSPFGGAARRLATNPISIGAPSGGEFPILLDFATSMAPEGKIRDYLRKEEALPKGWIVDSEGRPSQNAEDFYGPPEGAILPLGGEVGYKGFALALMIDILAGALSGAGCCSEKEVSPRDGILMIALDIEHFSGAVFALEQIRQVCDYVKSCPTAPGTSEIYVPGEIEFRQAEQYRRTGIPVDDTTHRELLEISERLGVEVGLNGHPHATVPRPKLKASLEKSSTLAEK